MTERPVQRRLAAILAADVVGYSRLMGMDEIGTRARYNARIDSVVQPALALHGGRLVNTMGDGFLVEFASVLGAVEAAVDIQGESAKHGRSDPPNGRMDFRIGIHVGDVIVEGDDIHGDGVNIAARLEALAEPGGVCISDTVHSGVRNKLALAFKDLGERSLKNIADPVQVYAVDMDSASPADLADSNALFRRPAVAVLPFENLSGDAEQEYFSDGLTEDIITALSLWRSFPVIARNSTFAYKGSAPDVRRVGEELGARYVVEGSVRKAGSRVRITVQLINAESGHHIWAEKYDRELEDIFALQDEITQAVAGTIQPEIVVAETERSKSKPPRNLDAWDLYLRGRAGYHSYGREGVTEAISLLRKSIELEPEFALAHAALAKAYQRFSVFGYAEDRQEADARSLESAERGVQLDRDNAETQVALGFAYMMSGDVREATSLYRAGLKANPSDAEGHSLLGLVLSSSGQAEDGIAHHETALRLSPHDPSLAIFYGRYANTCMAARKFEEAIEYGRKGFRLSNGKLWLAMTHAISALGHLGRKEEAQELVERLRVSKPDISVGAVQRVIQVFSTPDYVRFHAEGLRKAGLPESC